MTNQQTIKQLKRQLNLKDKEIQMLNSSMKGKRLREIKKELSQVKSHNYILWQQNLNKDDIIKKLKNEKYPIVTFKMWIDEIKKQIKMHWDYFKRWIKRKWQKM